VPRGHCVCCLGTYLEVSATDNLHFTNSCLMKVIVLLNRAAGTVNADTAVADAMAGARIEADLRNVPPDQLALEAHAAVESDADVVVAGGGDGTINTVAAALAGTDKPLGVLPLGTLNHFAKDLGIPLDLAGAAAVIAARHTASVDVGRVNDSIFINTSSIGLYSRAVLVREAERRRGWSKWWAMGLAMLKVFRRFPMLEVRLTTAEAAIHRRTPLVFVGNNRYEFDLLTVGTRNCVCAGELGLYIANTQSRWGMVRLAIRGAVGRLKQSRDFELSCQREFWIESHKRVLSVALDGEVVTLPPPLHYRTWPEALQVCVPKSEAERFERITEDSVDFAR
jgi:diacylglycerol kinase family enzyme